VEEGEHQMDFWDNINKISTIIGIAGSIVSIIGYLYPSTPKTSTQEALIWVCLPLALILILAGIVPYVIPQLHNQQHTQEALIRARLPLALILILAVIVPYVIPQLHNQQHTNATNNNYSTISTPLTGITTLSPTTEMQTPTMDTQNTTFSSNSGDLLKYQANWSKGTDGWNLKDSGWSVLGNGSIVSNGTPNKASYLDPVPNEGAIFAPYQPSTANYAVEVQAKITTDNSDDDCSFCIIVRNDGSLSYGSYSGYAEGLDDSTDLSTTFDRTAWHTYRVEAKYNQITFLIDGQQIEQQTSNTYLQPGRIGIADKQGTQAEVRSFKVFAL
jgi:uncharacterized protein YjeT (DUF2065 family)